MVLVVVSQWPSSNYRSSPWNVTMEVWLETAVGTWYNTCRHSEISTPCLFQSPIKPLCPWHIVPQVVSLRCCKQVEHGDCFCAKDRVQMRLPVWHRVEHVRKKQQERSVLLSGYCKETCMWRVSAVVFSLTSKQQQHHSHPSPLPHPAERQRKTGCTTQDETDDLSWKKAIACTISR